MVVPFQPFQELRHHYFSFTATEPAINLKCSTSCVTTVPFIRIHFFIMSDHDEAQHFLDLQEFLQSPRGDLRAAATGAVLDIVRDRHGLSRLMRSIDDIVALLAKNVAHPDSQVRLNALQALVHMTSNGIESNQCVEDLLLVGGMNRMMELVLSCPVESQDGKGGALDTISDAAHRSWRQRVNYAMVLVANMTRTEAGAIELVGRTLPEEAVAASDLQGKLPPKPTMELLLARFLNPNYVEPVDYAALRDEQDDYDAAMASQDGDPFQHFGSVLMNATQIESGRLFVLRIHRNRDDKDGLGKSVLQAILPQLRSPSPLRRRGVAGTVRNCCLDTDFTWWLLNVVKISSHVLFPLAGPEELDLQEKQGLDPDLWLAGPDKKREEDHLTRLFLVEAVLFLCTSGQNAREKLRKERIAVILKWADMVEEQEDVSERIGECMRLLGAMEATGVEATDTHASYQGRPVVAPKVGLDRNFDDVD